jgi:sugar lactone lactonase YvrE
VTRAEQLTDVITHHGEGAGWHRADGVLNVVDMLAGDVVTLGDDGAVSRLHVGEVAAAWRERTAGGLVVAVERGFALLDAEGRTEWSVDAWTDPSIRMNDGACDPQGRFYCGSMAYDERPEAATLWRLDTDGSVHPVLERLTISNGLVWSLDGSTAYHIDTPQGRVDGYSFDAEAGSFADRRTVAEVAGGSPDGMTIDAEGGLWVAIWRGSAVHRYSPDGELTAVVEVDARQVTSVAFGGAAYDRLFVTTSREGLDPGDDPRAGAVFVADVGVRGVPLASYDG